MMFDEYLQTPLMGLSAFIVSQQPLGENFALMYKYKYLTSGAEN